MQIVKYPRTPHLHGSRVQPGDEDLPVLSLGDAPGVLVVEEKLDGSNSAVSFTPDGQLLLQSRGHILTGGPRERQFDLFKRWAGHHQATLRQLLGARYLMYGEWLYARHTIAYDLLPHFFVEFDILDRESSQFLSTPARQSMLSGSPVVSAPVLAEDATASLETYLGKSTCASTEPMEGLYLKREHDGHVVGRYKYVRPSFLQAVEDSGSHWMDRPIEPNPAARGSRHLRMSLLPFLTPRLPDWRVDYASLTATHSWVLGMRDCPQDPSHHAEGDVWIHTGMVLEALAADPEFRALPETDREILFATALLHDVAKPRCTREENGRITSRGHSARGAIEARRILWGLGADFQAREQVCGLIRWHQQPFYLLNRPEPQRVLFQISQSARCDLLTLQARADILGRRCGDASEILTQIELFREYCREQQCLEGPRAFPSAHSRFLYFRTPGRDPNYLAHDDTRCEVTLLSGLPAAGKDTWIAAHASALRCISLDAIREATGAPPTGNQGAVIQAAREQARVYLRDSQSFVWNATNLSREIRTQLIDLFAAYHARVRIVYLETSADALFTRNAARAASAPTGAIHRLLDRWEVPDATEAHRVEHCLG